MDERYLTFGEQKKYKFILVGDSNVGKTALFWRFIEGEFSGEKNTLVTTVDFKMRNIVVKNKPVKLYIWDTAGQEKYRSIVSTYFKGCHGVLLVFDLSKPQSFEHVTQQWYEICKAKAEGATIFLVGSKADLEQQVSNQVIERVSKQKKIRFMKTSSKTGLNVEQLFKQMAKAVMEKQQFPDRTQSFALNSQKNFQSGQKKKCC